MRSFFIAQNDLLVGSRLPLPDDIRKHVQTVLRLKSGEKFRMFNDVGLVATVLLQGDGQVEVLQVEQAPPVFCHLTLIQGLPKGEKLEFILQKGTELGVNRFVLVPMDRSVGALKEERQEKKLQRWQKIIQEAARQCHQYRLPELVVCNDFCDAVKLVDADLRILLWEESDRPLNQILSDNAPGKASVIVGPEGGMTKAEAKIAQTQGYVSASLGPRILRTETAGLAMMSVLQYRYGDLAIGQ